MSLNNNKCSNAQLYLWYRLLTKSNQYEYPKYSVEKVSNIYQLMEKIDKIDRKTQPFNFLSHFHVMFEQAINDQILTWK